LLTGKAVVSVPIRRHGRGKGVAINRGSSSARGRTAMLNAGNGHSDRSFH